MLFGGRGMDMEDAERVGGRSDLLLLMKKRPALGNRGPEVVDLPVWFPVRGCSC